MRMVKNCSSIDAKVASIMSNRLFELTQQFPMVERLVCVTNFKFMGWSSPHMKFNLWFLNRKFLDIVNPDVSIHDRCYFEESYIESITVFSTRCRGCSSPSLFAPIFDVLSGTPWNTRKFNKKLTINEPFIELSGFYLSFSSTFWGENGLSVSSSRGLFPWNPFSYQFLLYSTSQ